MKYGSSNIRGTNPNVKVSRVMIVAGEASGDLHGGALARALLEKNPSLNLIGFGGDAMRQAGVNVRFDIEQLAVVGLFEVLFHIKTLIQAYWTACRLLREKIDLLVLIDYPDFNLCLAKSAKQLGIPVVYYVSPQIWAWRSGRIKTIAERIDQMLVILPFEKELYTSKNIPCEFVGHPLLDEVKQKGMPFSLGDPAEEASRKKAYLAKKGLDPLATTVGLLPGSRKREVLSHLPVMLQSMASLAKKIPGLQVLIPVASSLPQGLIEKLIRSSLLPIRCVEGEVYEVMRASQVMVVVSGTATLQGALAGTPMVIIYKLSWITYQIARLVIRLKWAGLANIVAEKPFIPELMQYDVTPENIAEEVGRLLKDEVEYEKMRQGLKVVASRLGTAGASDRAASVICRLLEKSMTLEGGFRNPDLPSEVRSIEKGRKLA
ncbi:MAG: lipid-A-disaccharide synthase [Nitrospira sp.]|nr:lipid-A-disaccharide synthase [Candidatus Manganitrophaceae bacterium]HIL35542.1 lipid-A-disaccharide synthase [Candidatus Manganitrophaceae bacterium]